MSLCVCFKCVCVCVYVCACMFYARLFVCVCASFCSALFPTMSVLRACTESNQRQHKSNINFINECT